MNASCEVGFPTVPDPTETSPDVEETDHEAPEGIGVFVVAVTLVGTPTAERSGVKLTVVGRVATTIACAYARGAPSPAILP